MTAYLGISADYHDSAAALLIDGEIVAAAAEERFTRVKHDARMPVNAIRWCLEHAGVGRRDLESVTFYSKPFTAYERILFTHASAGPRGFGELARAVGQWSRSKLWAGYRIERTLAHLGFVAPKVRFCEHHDSHAASAFYPSPFDSAAILTFDGVGEWATATISRGVGNTIEPIEALMFPDSIGLLYSSFTAFCGFGVNDGEYKLMGLAPYGQPRFEAVLRDQVVRIHDDGSVKIDQSWFDYRAGRSMTSTRLGGLLEGPARRRDEPLTQREADIASSIQVILEDILLRTAVHARQLTDEANVVLAGGVALNCVANSRLQRDGPFAEMWIQPAAGDDGGALGAALWAWHQLDENPRSARCVDAMSGSFLGPAFEVSAISQWLVDNEVPFTVESDLDALCDAVARALAAGKVVGWFRGRMEFGPRALGNRSILADPRDPTMTSHLNLAVKRREDFRPFAPAVLAERASDWFDLDRPSPYMLRTATVVQEHRVIPEREGETGSLDPRLGFKERLATSRSTIPACTHVDYSARVQTVDADTNPDFHRLLSAFERRTGCPVLVNTSFNLKDEPIVRSPADAYRCFLESDIDLLVMEGCVVAKDQL